ncbi:aldehyde dehydrogenase family protein [Kineococcus aurantiacus]|uniref:Betaine-aldehyde dehydrogenase n=1 Tax=Kineococcus aurantiacus TaxID=37633 RepID=A0A7Y9ART4_9ACTN|nr:betaine-aldehyde dehydrogenase [Kineococcus aurantiacus]
MPDLFVAGRWRSAAAGGTRDVVNPFDAEVFAVVDEAAAEDAEAAVLAARAAFDEGSWARAPVAERAALLDRVADLLQRDREEIARTETLDTGKTLAESRIDVDDVTAVFRYYAREGVVEVDRTVDVGRPEVVSRVVHHAVGVCTLIAPWNYPLLQMSWKVAPALVAGNTVVLKPSEVTPLTTVHLVRLLEEAGAPPGVVNLVLGAGGAVGPALTSHPAVDLVSFTGGLATGRAIAKAAAETVKRVTVELGGKNPNIVFADVDLDVAIDTALTGVFLHSGQVCSSGTRLIVEESIADELVAGVVERARRIRFGNGLEDGVESGPLVSAQHREKVEGYVALGQQEGARLLTGGRRPDDPVLQRGFFHEPTVFDDCDRGMRIVQEETFGPILTVERFRTEEEAVFLGNDTTYGLAGAVQTLDVERGERVAGALRHGTVWINDFGPYVPQAEWGGQRMSGNGRELGPAGLAEYRETKHVWRTTRPAAPGWFRG